MSGRQMSDPWQIHATPASHGTLASHLSCPHLELQAEGISELLPGTGALSTVK